MHFLKPRRLSRAETWPAGRGGQMGILHLGVHSMTKGRLQTAEQDGQAILDLSLYLQVGIK